jgi:glyoxylase-like metal-dependent hydrolase (beta-lactamase superfamily II)
MTELLIMLLLWASPAVQQPAQPLVVTKLTPNVYWTQGGAGGNTGIIIGQTGVIVIDAKTTTDSAKEMIAAIAKLTPKPVTQVILTHSDADHVNGLAAFPAGVGVIAHEGAKREMETALAAGGRGAPPPDRMPSRVIVRTGETVTIDGVTMELHHWAPAHTSGDLVVYLPAEKIVFTGDIIAAQRPDPLIHLEKQGSSEGWITTVKGLLGLGATQFVPGHGDLQTKDQVQARLQASADKRDKIVALVKDGKSLDEIKAAVGDPPSPPPAVLPAASGRTQGAAPAAGRGGPGFASFTEVVYQELTKR